MELCLWFLAVVNLLFSLAFSYVALFFSKQRGLIHLFMMSIIICIINIFQVVLGLSTNPIYIIDFCSAVIYAMIAFLLFKPLKRLNEIEKKKHKDDKNQLK